MKKGNLKWITVFTVSISILTGCRTMQLNQDGKVLGKGMFESAAGGGVAFVSGASSSLTFAASINAEFQQRFGIGEKTEVQLKVHNDFTASGGAPGITFGFSQINEADFAVKINTYDKNGYAFSLLPFGGLELGLSNINVPMKGGFPLSMLNITGTWYINPNTGIALIGSKLFEKLNFYWGGTFNFSPNIGYMVFGIPSFETDLTFNWGWEIPKDRIVYRHEIDLFCQVNWYGMSPPFLNFGIGYHFAAGVRYGKNQSAVVNEQ